MNEMNQKFDFPQLPANNEERLQLNFELYCSRMREILLQVLEIRAALLDEVEVLNPDFKTDIIAAQNDYNGVLKKVLTDAATSIQSVHDISGTAGFVVGFVQSGFKALSQAAQVQNRVFTTLATQHKQAPLLRIEQLKGMKATLTTHEKSMDKLYNNNITFKQNPLHANTIKAGDIHCQYELLSQKVKQEVDDTVKKISEYLTLQETDETTLLHELMSIHLTRGTNGASVAGPNAPMALIGHHFRKRRMKATLTGSAFFKASDRHEPTKLDMQWLTAIQKRYQMDDFNAGSRHYTACVRDLRAALHLIGKSDLTLCEKIILSSPLALSNTDKAANKDATLNGLLLVQRGVKREEALRETLAGHLSSNTLDELQMKCATIIEFYVESLIQQFLTHPLFQDWVENHSTEDNIAAGEKDLLTLIVKIINAELQDKTPSDYYHSFLCGVNLFCASIAERGSMKLELDNDTSTLNLNFSDCLASPQSANKREITHTRMEIKPVQIIQSEMF